MRTFKILGCLVATLATTAGPLAPAQTFGASTGTDPLSIRLPNPADPGMGKVSVPGHHRSAEEVRLYGRVRNGVYTVDGMVAKVQLNYDLDGVRFLYLFVPGLGTAVVSAAPDPDAVTETAKLQNNELSFALGEHRFKLTGIALASDRGTPPEHLFVKLDRAAWRLNRQPMMGFGNAAAQPYVWPGALRSEEGKPVEETVVAPPVPRVLLPSPTAVAPRAATPAAVQPVILQPVSMR